MNDRLYNLLPVVYRQRDGEVGEPLRQLLSVISEQVDVVEADIAQLYENWFIETCQGWVVPYIGDLIDYRLVHEAGEPADAGSPEGQLRNKFLIPRREVGNTIRFRRRKGTLALLELLARSIANWPARAVEFDRRLGATQSLNHLRLDSGQTADLRRGAALQVLNSPFDALAHTIDVRRPGSSRTAGRYGIPAIGLFVWRINSYPVTHSEAYCIEEAAEHCFSFSALGNDIPLFNLPIDDPDQTRAPSELNVAGPIRRRALEERVIEGGVERRRASANYYGEGKSLSIRVRKWGAHEQEGVIPREQIIPADLSEWRYHPRRGFVAVDPELGRISFAPGNVPEHVLVSYQYGFSADLGGGEYDRPLRAVPEEQIVRVEGGGREARNRIGDALQQWKKKHLAHGVIEIEDSRVYDEERLHIELEEHQSLEIRAAQGARPTIRLVDLQAGRVDAMTVRGKPHSRFSLDGLLIAGRGVQVKGDLGEIVIRHSTLVPGWGLHPDCRPRHPSEPSLAFLNTRVRAIVEHSNLGSIQVDQDDMDLEPLPLRISDSIVDATAHRGQALWSADSVVAFATLNILRSTVLGDVKVHAVELAENSIFRDTVNVARRQRGCFRFCYVHPHSRTPRRYECQPDLSGAAPAFNSIRYGTPAYCQLAESCPDGIRRGADDQSEMGVFHDLFQPQRDTLLRARLDEYVPAGSEAGIFYV